MSSSLASEDRKVDYEEKGGNQLDTDVASAETHAKQTHRPIAWLWKVAKKLDSYGVEVSLFFCCNLSQIPRFNPATSSVPETLATQLVVLSHELAFYTSFSRSN